MNVVRRALAAAGSLLPVPRDLDDSRPVVDPRVDPAALEAFGDEEAESFGAAPDHLGAVPAPIRFTRERARDARDAERRADNG